MALQLLLFWHKVAQKRLKSAKNRSKNGQNQAKMNENGSKINLFSHFPRAEKLLEAAVRL